MGYTPTTRRDDDRRIISGTLWNHRHHRYYPLKQSHIVIQWWSQYKVALIGRHRRCRHHQYRNPCVIPGVGPGKRYCCKNDCDTNNCINNSKSMIEGPNQAIIINTNTAVIPFYSWNMNRSIHWEGVRMNRTSKTCCGGGHHHNFRMTLPPPTTTTTPYYYYSNSNNKNTLSSVVNDCHGPITTATTHHHD